MKQDTIMPSRADIAKILDYNPETGAFTWRVNRRGRYARAGSAAGTKRPDGYLRIELNTRPYYCHRLAFLLTHGTWPNEYIDHINGDTSDNRISNLRAASQSQNMQNARLRDDNKTGFKGVFWDANRGQYLASIHELRKEGHQIEEQILTHNGKRYARYYIPTFKLEYA